MKRTRLIKTIETLEAAANLIEKCGGPGGKPGPCPKPKPAEGGESKPPTESPERQIVRGDGSKRIDQEVRAQVKAIEQVAGELAKLSPGGFGWFHIKQAVKNLKQAQEELYNLIEESSEQP